MLCGRAAKEARNYHNFSDTVAEAATFERICLNSYLHLSVSILWMHRVEVAADNHEDGPAASSSDVTASYFHSTGRDRNAAMNLSRRPCILPVARQKR
jgi:hypothetical protein